MPDSMKVKDREPKQGEQFTEPKMGGLYPMAGVVIAALAVGAVAAVLALF